MLMRCSLLLTLVLGLGTLVPTHSEAQSEAEQALKHALSEAEQSGRLVFLHSGAPWCGWCKRLEDWLVREDIAPIFSKDFVSVKIDVDEMQGGRKLMDRYDNGYGGVPLLVILRSDGTVLVNSFAPNGRNIGSPYTDWEIDHWNTMMRTAAKRITEDEIMYMAQTLAEDRT
jgi:thiol-disulfide isomerase/thioredoxin